MAYLNIEEVIEATAGKLASGNKECVLNGVSHDSRNIGEGQLFVAIVGENHDGHRFIEDAYLNGCRTFLVSDLKISEKQLEEKPEEVCLVVVPDTSLALGKLAGYYVDKIGVRIIGVTGSVGKTSTKDMIRSVCAQRYTTYCNEGNYNNHIGLPLTVLRFKDDAEIGVLEMGMDKRGEIEYLASLVRPEIGVITNIGIAHLEHLGSQCEIFKAKIEIANGFGRENTLLVYKDEKYLNSGRIGGEYSLVTVGQTEDCDIVIQASGEDFTVRYGKTVGVGHMPVPGHHNVKNAGLAIGVGLQLGLTIEEAIKGIEEVEITSGRLTIHEACGVRVIDDSYNASPDSMKAGIDVLSSMEGDRKVAVLGDMFEIGEQSAHFHRQVGQYAAEKKLDILITVGSISKNILEGFESSGMKGHHFEDKEKASQWILKHLIQNDVVLIKGSRGMHMEEIVEDILDNRRNI